LRKPHAIQDQYKLVPLSAYGKPYTPPPGKVDPSIDMKTPPREQVEQMDTISYFKLGRATDMLHVLAVESFGQARRDVAGAVAPSEGVW
jgi:hypothetical protein